MLDPGFEDDVISHDPFAARQQPLSELHPSVTREQVRLGIMFTGEPR
jgi:hypothetical protein